MILLPNFFFLLSIKRTSNLLSLTIYFISL